MKALLEKIRKLLKDRRFRNIWYRFVSVVAAVLVFITTYALVLPAITMEKTAACGIEEHQHDSSCYESRLICGQEESEGHHHDDNCYTVTQEMVCDLEEHQHSNENGCYDGEGNLICEIPEHLHGESCYQEVETLTCGQEESEGHGHTDSCYEDVLVCGKEAHIHSTECYKEDSSAVAVMDEAAGGASTVTSGGSDSAGSDAMPEEYVEDGTSGMTEMTEELAVSDPSVPQLDPVNMDAMMTKDTGFYYFHAEEGEDIPSNSAGITDWQMVEKDTKLSSTDLVKAYFVYKIPAGSLNESNPIARYRLPGNLHLTDDQIDAINHTENGVYASMDQEAEAAEAQKYLGAEAVEGNRKPDEELMDGAQEYISAVVRVENAVDENGQYLGQDLVFTFVPYTIEKNQNTYDADGSQLTAGEKITGWFACDFTMSQIDWVEEETDLDSSTAEKSAEVVFVEEKEEIGTKEISTVLNLVETDETDEPDDADGTTTDAEETDTAEYQTGTLTADGDGYKITLDYTEEAKIPANAELSVKEITLETDKEAYEAYLEQAKKQVTGDDKSTVDETASRFFDIEIVVRNIGGDAGESESVQKIEPAAPVYVNIQITDASRNADSASESGKTEQSDPKVLHFAEEGVEQIDSTVKDSSEQKNGEGQSTEVQFEAESFSVYGLVYTVDFHREVDGKTYEFSLAGGDSVSFRKLVEMLHIVDADTQENNDEEEENAGDSAEGDEPVQEIVTDVDAGAVNSEEIGNSEGTASGEEIGSSEAIDEFMNDIADIRFSDESLVKVARITEGITAGALKEKFDLSCEYSAELTVAEREAMDSKVFYPVDWALISLKAFDSEEMLTVTMKDSEQFEIAVTDAQLTHEYITSSGDTFTITVIYNDDAHIPDGAELKVREVRTNSSEYDTYLSGSAEELGIRNTDITFARFFDIEIIKDGEKIEPATPVHVRIEYKDALEAAEDQSLKIVHFGEEKTEVISDLNLSENKTRIEYQQNSFSVTGTIITDGGANHIPSNGQYILLVNYPNGSDNYYVINNDGSLTKVVYHPSQGTVDVDDPMLWTIDGGNPNRHIWFNTEATGYNTFQTASGFYHRYLDPSSPNGILEETNGTGEGHVDIGYDYSAGGVNVTNRDNVLSKTALNTNGDSIYKEPWGNNHIGVQLDSDGNPVHIAGQQSADDRVNIVYARAEAVPETNNVGDATNTVNHIDIAISGTTEITVPLAYGTYYYEDSNGDMQPYTVLSDTSLELKKDQVRIYPDDMKRATIKAYDKDGNELNDAFVITGYSANQKTEYSDVQVRIEGVFKVSTINETGNNNNYNLCQRRKNETITYIITAPKELTFDLIETDHNYGQLYEQNADGTYSPLSITLDVNMGASFDYWDENNACPALLPSYVGQEVNNLWKRGGIPRDASRGYLSGMDFVLGGDAEDANNKIVAIEISKLIVDESGQLIQLEKKVSNSFDIYRNGAADRNEFVKDSNVEEYTSPYPYQGYSHLHSKDVVLGTDGMGIVYDYAVDDGMYYITEDPDSIEDEITDAEGNTWDYRNSYILTEYVRRGYGDYDNKELYPSPMHYSKTYTKTDSYSGSDQDAAFRYASIPEALGTFTRLDGQVKKEGFLEFFVYNVYTNGTKLEVEKEWEPEDNVPSRAEIAVELQYRKRLIGHMGANDQTELLPDSQIQPWEEAAVYKPVSDDQGEKGEKLFDAKLNTKLILKADTTVAHNWKGAFTGLPKTVTDAEGNVYEVDYNAEEISVKIPAAGKTVIDEDAIEIKDQYKVNTVKTEPSAAEADYSDGKVTITNIQGDLIFEKKWLSSNGQPAATPTNSPAVITAELWRTKTTVTETENPPVTVTIKGKAQNYNNNALTFLWSGSVRRESDMKFSLAVAGTSRPSITTEPNCSGGYHDEDKDDFTYTSVNGGTFDKTNQNVYTLENITENTVVTADFGSANVNQTNGIGYYIVAQNTDPGTSTSTSTVNERVNIEGKVINGVVTLNQANNWRFELTAEEMDPDWTYYIKTGSITEEGISQNQFTFNAGPEITKDVDGNTVYTSTNISKAINVMVRKVAKEYVNETDTSTLSGATFTLTKYTKAPPFGASDKDPSWSDVTIADDDNTTSGEFLFTGLSEGYYCLTEDICPPGYVKISSDPVFHVKPNESGALVIVLVDQNGNDMEETTTDLLRVENDTAAGSHTLTVGNTSGAALPSTGGPGIRAIYLIGLMLAGMSGIVLLLRQFRNM